jgi:hypothetical protein
MKKKEKRQTILELEPTDIANLKNAKDILTSITNIYDIYENATVGDEDLDYYGINATVELLDILVDEKKIILENDKEETIE